MKSIRLRTCLLVLAVAAAAVCQATESVKHRKPAGSDAMNSIVQGTYTFGVGGASSTSSGNTATVFNINGSMFVSNEISIGIMLGYASATGANTTTTYGAEGRYYFGATPDKTFAPFLGAMYSTTSGGGATVNSLGGEVGFDYFLAKNVSLTPRYMMSRLSGGGGSADVNTFALGMTFWFSGK